MGKKPEVIWMEVTNDEYELPVAVADTTRELAEMTGVRRNAIMEAWSRYNHGIYKRCRWHKVCLEDAE